MTTTSAATKINNRLMLLHRETRDGAAMLHSNKHIVHFLSSGQVNVVMISMIKI